MKPDAIRKIVFPIFCAIGIFLIFYTAPGNSVKPTKLKIEQSFNLPIAEASGLAIRRQGAGYEGVVVGDADAKIIKFSVVDQSVKHLKTLKFKKILRKKLCDQDKTQCKKSRLDQWEGIAWQEKNNRLFILKEDNSTIVELSIEPLAVQGIFGFAFEQEVLAQLFNQASNSLGEGLDILDDGTFLIVKEKNPALIGQFSFKDRKNLTLQHLWQIPPDFGDCDISDIDAKSLGDVFILSESCRSIIALAPLDHTKKTFAIKEKFKLPKKIRRPEGLVRLEKGQVLVCADNQDKKRDNLFLLTIPRH